MREAIKNFLRSLIVFIDGGKQISDERRQMAKAIGIVFNQQEATARIAESNCSHRKAGMVRLTGSRASIRHGLNNGNSAQYAVRKHQMMNGDMWIDCLRCGKKWRPPVIQTFSWFERKFRTEAFQNYVAAWAEYDLAKHFETNNVTSSSLQCAFHDPKTGKRADGQVRAMYAAMGE